MKYEISKKEVDKLYNRLNRESDEGGYNLNPDLDFTKDLVKGLLLNEKRYGYWACPCRLASGNKKEDLDIICPCDYRDPDLNEYGTCFCALYVSQEIKNGVKHPESIPESRPENPDERSQYKSKKTKSISEESYLDYPVWRCRVCGYLCAREKPPGICPICKAKKDRFEVFLDK